MRRLVVLLASLGSSCGAPVPASAPAGPPIPRTDESTFGPLDVGANYQSFRRLTDKPFLSRDHGNRWVDVYVNERGADAYLSNRPIPVGTIVVKPSWQNHGGRPSSVAGPIFVMEKQPPGYAPEHGDWWYGLHWAAPPPEDRAKFGGPVYWRGRSPKIEYCWTCHDDYDRGLGGLAPSSILIR